MIPSSKKNSESVNLSSSTITSNSGSHTQKMSTQSPTNGKNTTKAKAACYPKDKSPIFKAIYNFALEHNLFLEEKDFSLAQQFSKDNFQRPSLAKRTKSAESDDSGVSVPDNWNVINVEELRSYRNELILKHALWGGCCVDETAEAFGFLCAKDPSKSALDMLPRCEPREDSSGVKDSFLDSAIVLKMYRNVDDYYLLFQTVYLCCDWPVLWGASEEKTENSVRSESQMLKKHMEELLGLDGESFGNLVTNKWGKYGSEWGKALLLAEVERYLEHLENNSLSFYSPDSFETRQHYCIFHQKESARIRDLLRAFYSAPFHAGVKYDKNKRLSSCEEGDSPKDYHSLFRDLVFLLLSFAEEEGILGGGKEAVLSPLSNRLLNEFELRYGVSSVFRSLVMTEYFFPRWKVETGATKYGKCIIRLLGDLLVSLGVEDGKATLTKRESQMLSDTVDELIFIVKKKFSRFEKFEDSDAAFNPVNDYIQILDSYSQLYFLIGKDVEFDTTKSLMEDILLDCVIDCLKQSFIDFSKSIRPGVVIGNEVDIKIPVRSEMLLCELEFIRETIVSFKENYGEPLKPFLDTESVAVLAFSECLSSDISAFCSSVFKDQRIVDKNFYQFVLQVVELCRDFPVLKGANSLIFFWNHFFAVVDKWIDSLSSSLLSLLTLSSGRQHFEPTCVNISLYVNDTHLKNKLESRMEQGSSYVIPDSRILWDLLLGTSLYSHFICSLSFLRVCDGEQGKEIYEETGKTIDELMYERRLSTYSRSGEGLNDVLKFFIARQMTEECKTVSNDEFIQIVEGYSVVRTLPKAFEDTEWKPFITNLKELLPQSIGSGSISNIMNKFKFRSRTVGYYMIKDGDFTRMNDIECCVNYVQDLKLMIYKGLKNERGYCCCGNMSCFSPDLCELYRGCFGELDDVQKELACCWRFQVEKLCTRLVQVVKACLEVYIADRGAKVDVRCSLRPMFKVIGQYHFQIQQRLYPDSYCLVTNALLLRIMNVFLSYIDCGDSEKKDLPTDIAYTLLICLDMTHCFLSGIWMKNTRTQFLYVKRVLQFYTLSTESLIKVLSVEQSSAMNGRTKEMVGGPANEKSFFESPCASDCEDTEVDDPQSGVSDEGGEMQNVKVEVGKDFLETSVYLEKVSERVKENDSGLSKCFHVLHMNTSLIKFIPYSFGNRLPSFSGKDLIEALITSRMVEGRSSAVAVTKAFVGRKLLVSASDAALDVNSIDIDSLYRFSCDDENGRRVLYETEILQWSQFLQNCCERPVVGLFRLRRGNLIEALKVRAVQKDQNAAAFIEKYKRAVNLQGRDPYRNVYTCQDNISSDAPIMESSLSGQQPVCVIESDALPIAIGESSSCLWETLESETSQESFFRYNSV